MYKRQDYQSAIALIKVAIANFKSPSAQQSLELTQLEKQLTSALEAFPSFQKAKQELLASPNDPNANRIVGNYAAFHASDWETALFHWSNVAEPELQSLAKRDLAGTTVSAEMLEIADSWRSMGLSTNDVHAKGKFLGLSLIHI